MKIGGCGKPGHTTCTGDEGTSYCLTCELERENAELKAVLVESCELAEPGSCGPDKSKVSIDVLKCLPSGIRKLMVLVDALENARSRFAVIAQVAHGEVSNLGKKGAKYMEEILKQFYAEEHQ